MDGSAGMVTLDGSRLGGFRDFIAAEAALESGANSDADDFKGSLMTWLRTDDGSKKKFAIGILVGLSLSGSAYGHGAASMYVAPSKISNYVADSGWMAREIEFLAAEKGREASDLVNALLPEATEALARMLPLVLSEDERVAWATELVHSVKE